MRNINKRYLQISILCIILIGILIKIYLLPVKTGDFNVFLEPWINFIKSHGFYASLEYKFYDYSPTYIYILIIIAKLGLNPLFAIKLVSIVFEYLAAFFIGKIAYLKFKNKSIIWVSLAIVPIIPTVILNSSYLSQCDSIYTSFILGSIYFLLKKRQLTSVIFLGIAFIFKLQTLIILPFFFVFLLKGEIKWYYFFIIPIIFVISIIPAWLAGRPFLELLSVYIAQTDRYQNLTLNFPNLYIWINNNFYYCGKNVGLIFTFILTLFSGLYLSKIELKFNFENWIRLAFLSSIIIPFILPGMHERYMYLGDLLGVLYFLVFRKNLHFTLGILLVSLYSYIRCSRYNDILPMWPAFLVYLTIIIFLIIDFSTSIKVIQNEKME